MCMKKDTFWVNNQPKITVFGNTIGMCNTAQTMFGKNRQKNLNCSTNKQ